MRALCETLACITMKEIKILQTALRSLRFNYARTEACTCSCLVSLVLLWMSEETSVYWWRSAKMRSSRTMVRLPHFPTRLYTTPLGNGSTCNTTRISATDKSVWARDTESGVTIVTVLLSPRFQEILYNTALKDIG